MQPNTTPLEIRMPFCSRPECRLHLEPGDDGVIGEGNWAELDGIVFGRQLIDGRMVCDFCANDAPRTRAA